MTMARRVAVITDTIEADGLFGIWHNYYSAMFGKQNLYVVTYANRSARFAGYDLAGVLEIPEEYNDPARAAFISAQVQALLARYDYVIRGDVDEIVVPDPRVAPDLSAYLGTLGLPYVTGRGFEVIEGADDPPLDLRSPILVRQRKLSFRNSALNKTCITSIPIQWTLGFHGGTIYPRFDDLFIFHLKYADIQSRLSWFGTMKESAPGYADGQGYWATALQSTQELRQAMLSARVLTGWDCFGSGEFDRRYLDTMTIDLHTGQFTGLFFLDDHLLEIPEEFAGMV